MFGGFGILRTFIQATHSKELNRFSILPGLALCKIYNSLIIKDILALATPSEFRILFILLHVVGLQKLFVV